MSQLRLEYNRVGNLKIWNGMTFSPEGHDKTEGLFPISKAYLEKIMLTDLLKSIPVCFVEILLADVIFLIEFGLAATILCLPELTTNCCQR